MERKLLEGMFLYEIVLLLLGVLLFIVVLVILVIKTLTGQPITVVMPFFVLPVLMIGFPGIQNFKFMNGLAEVEMRAEEITKNPGNKELEKKQKLQIELLSSRPIRHPENQLIMAEAYESINALEKAKQYTQRVIDKQPDNTDAMRLESRITIKENINRLEQNPMDSQAKQIIKNEISRLEIKPETKQEDLITLARGNMAIGNTQRAQMYADSVKKINPRIQKPFDR